MVVEVVHLLWQWVPFRSVWRSSSERMRPWQRVQRTVYVLLPRCRRDAHAKKARRF